MNCCAAAATTSRSTTSIGTSHNVIIAVTIGTPLSCAVAVTWASANQW